MTFENVEKHANYDEPDASAEESSEKQIEIVEIDIDAPLKCGFSIREIAQMKKAGMQKPALIPWSDWLGPKKINHRHMLLCHLAALGARSNEIAAATGFTDSRISLLLGTEPIQKQIKIIREVEFQGMGVKDRLEQLSSHAVRIYDEILSSPKARLALKYRAAADILDRKMGKPQQSVEVKTNMLSDFYELLQKIDANKNTIDAEVKPLEEQLEAAQIISPAKQGGTSNEREQEVSSIIEAPKAIDKSLLEDL